MRSFWGSTQFTLAGNATTVYLPIFGVNISGDATEVNTSIPISEDVTITGFSVWLTATGGTPGGAPGTGVTRTLTIRDDAVGTAAAVSISNTSTSGTWSGSVSISALSLVSVQSTVTGGTPPACYYWATIEYTTGGEYFVLPTLLGGSFGGGLSGTVTAYAMAGSSVTSMDTTITNNALVSPISGTITKHVGVLKTAPGASKTWAVSVRKNNSTDSHTLTFTGAAGTSANVTSSVAIAAGDRLNIKAVPTSTPTASVFKGSLTIAPTVAGLTILPGGQASLPTATTANYSQLWDTSTGWNTSEIKLYARVPAGTVSNLYTTVPTAPGTSKSRIFTLRVNSVDTAVTTTISGAGTTANDTTHSVTTVAGDQFVTKTTATGTSLVSTPVYFAATFNYPPAAASNTGQFFVMF